MKYLLKTLGYYAIFIVLITFICSLLNLIGVNSTITNLIIFIFNMIMFFFLGFKNGKCVVSKGYIAGIKMSLLFILLLIVINLFTARNFFSISTIVYYVILMLSGIAGSMIGINKKDANKH